MIRRLLILVVLAALLPVAVTGQETLTVRDVNPLSVSSGASARIFPAPNAQVVAYDSSIRLNSHVDRYLTISTVAPDDAPTYFDKPEDLPRGFEADASSFYIPFAWSPDSARLAVTSQPLVTLTDTDLWVFDPSSETWTNLADDGYSGGITPADSPMPGTMIDIQPAWSPDGTMIAAERTIIGDDSQFAQPHYTLIDAATGEAHNLASVPGTASTGATTSMGWSADGSTLAVSLLHRNRDAANDGMWLVDVRGNGEARRLVTLEQIEGALHGVLADLEMTTVGPVIWSPDGTRLLLWAGKTEGSPAQVWPFVVDTASGEITPAPIPAHPRDSTTARGLRPLQAAWSPDGTRLMVFTFGLHPDEATTSLDPTEESVRGAVRILDLASAQSQLVGYLPLGKTPFFYAAWSPDSNVIINGYHFVLDM